MKAAIFSFIPVVPKSMVASTRIASLVHGLLDIPLVWDELIEEYTDLDVLFIVNGAYRFCNVLEPLSHAVRTAKRIVWIQNDYSIVPPINDGQATSPFRRAFVQRRELGKPHLDYWTTCEVESKATQYSTYINWNCLSMQGKVLKAFAYSNDVAYYGSYRQGRVQHFDKYFKLPKCDMIISSPSRKFQETYRSTKIKHVGVINDLLKWLSERGLGLYLEDRRSHKNYHSPPNRFYEMLSAGLPMVFQEEAGSTLRRAGYNPANFVVTNSLHVARMLDIRDKIKLEQQSSWWATAQAENDSLHKKVHAAYKLLEGAF